jgi:hypothetical protein
VVLKGDQESLENRSSLSAPGVAIGCRRTFCFRLMSYGPEKPRATIVAAGQCWGQRKTEAHARGFAALPALSITISTLDRTLHTHHGVS